MVLIRIFDLNKEGQGHKIQRPKYVVGWRFSDLKEGEEMADLSHSVFHWSTNEAYADPIPAFAAYNVM